MRRAAKTALDAAGVVVMERARAIWSRWIIPLGSGWNIFFAPRPVIIEHTEFGASVVCTLMVRVADEENLLAEITRVTDGKAETLEDGTLFYPWPVED